MTKKIEALEKENTELKSRIHNLEEDLEYQKRLVRHFLEEQDKAFSVEIKEALEKKQNQKLDRVEYLTKATFKERRNIGEEYIKWCVKNNAKYDDTTTMITWAFCIKLKEVLK